MIVLVVSKFYSGLEQKPTETCAEFVRSKKAEEDAAFAFMKDGIFFSPIFV
jgi:hypothetical protein